MTNKKLKILFLCTGNACRSQMAEGWARHLKSDVVEAYSAGVAPLGYITPNTIKVMTEAGVNITDQHSKSVDEVMNIDFDYVITLCGHANLMCPTFPGETKIILVPFNDPFSLEQEASSEKEALKQYRRIRDEIRRFVEKIPGNLM